jgi:hypothetical protein
MISTALVRYVLTAALRDRLLLAVAAVTVVGVCLSIFSASSAVVEPDKFAVVYMASGLRILGLVGLSLFVVFFIRRSFDARDIEYLLSRPISRATLVCSNAVAFSLLAMIAGGLLMLVIWGAAYRNGAPEGILLWAFGVTAEYILLANVAFFFAMVLSSPVSAGLAVMGFYVLSRMMGQLLGIIGNHPEPFPGIELLIGAFKMVSMVAPRLDLMTQTSWLLYGVNSLGDYVFIIVQAVVFLLLVLVATLVDLVRKQF